MPSEIREKKRGHNLEQRSWGTTWKCTGNVLNPRFFETSSLNAQTNQPPNSIIVDGPMENELKKAKLIATKAVARELPNPRMLKGLGFLSFV